MAQTRCRNGHIYNTEIYGENCPYCRDTGTAIEFGQGGARPKPGPEPQPIRPVYPAATRARDDWTVGWLVCVKGCEPGRSFELGNHVNSIGSGEGMDLVIRGEPAVSADTHARLDYDELNNDFYLIPANNRKTIYIGRTPVYAAQKLKALDRIRFGKSEFLFMPLCCEHFTWPPEDGAEAAEAAEDGAEEETVPLTAAAEQEEN